MICDTILTSLIKYGLEPIEKCGGAYLHFAYCPILYRLINTVRCSMPGTTRKFPSSPVQSSPPTFSTTVLHPSLMCY